jgi:hypothetical protein
MRLLPMMIPICALSGTLASDLFRVAPNRTSCRRGATGPNQLQGESRLETNTSVPHITDATLRGHASRGPGEPRVRIPVKRFLACFFTLPFTLDDSPVHAGCPTRAAGSR